MKTALVRSLIACAVLGATYLGLGPTAPSAVPIAAAVPSVQPDTIAGGTPSVKRAAPQLLFATYPGGGTGETPNAPPVNPDTVVQRLSALRGDSPFGVHLYTAWSWHDPAWLDRDIERYLNADLRVTMTIKYAPPPGHEGDVDGYVAFVRGLMRDYSRYPGIARFVIGNEANQGGNPEASDGAYDRAAEAVALGAVAAREELDAAGSSAQIGINMATTGRERDAQFLKTLVDIAGPRLHGAVACLGINTYPGVWYDEGNDPYDDMLARIRDARYALDDAGFDPGVSLDIMENGFPTADEGEQAERLTAMVQAVLDNYIEYGVSRYSWFDLWDADSSASDRFFHYGLLRSDLSPKPAFERYRDLIAGRESGRETWPPHSTLPDPDPDPDAEAAVAAH